MSGKDLVHTALEVRLLNVWYVQTFKNLVIKYGYGNNSLLCLLKT